MVNGMSKVAKIFIKKDSPGFNLVGHDDDIAKLRFTT
jgi:hypothetical protein